MLTITVIRDGRREPVSGRTLDSITRRVFGRSATLRRDHSPAFSPETRTYWVHRTDRHGTHVLGRIIAPANAPRS